MDLQTTFGFFQHEWFVTSFLFRTEERILQEIFFLTPIDFFSHSLSRPFVGRTGPNQKIKKNPAGYSMYSNTR